MGEQSMLTVNIYMNSDFEGGSTRFYASNTIPEADLTVQPKRVFACCFDNPPKRCITTMARGWSPARSICSGVTSCIGGGSMKQIEFLLSWEKWTRSCKGGGD